MKKALLFINGQPPKKFPKLEDFETVFCTDGAYHYLEKNKITPDFVVGDFDSIDLHRIPKNIFVLQRPNQNFTDFDKCMQEIVNQGFGKVDVWGATGLEHDHFLGNLSTALRFKEQIQMTFWDDYSRFFFIPKKFSVREVKHRTLSLFPFPFATRVHSTGLHYPLNGMDLEIGKQVGTRNFATENEVSICFEQGEILLFISNNIS